MSVTIYYFDPDGDACDICQGMGGCYEDEPERPHENCDCVIEEHTLDEGCEIEYRNASSGQCQEDRAGLSIDFENCGEPQGSQGFEVSEGPEDDMDSEIRAVAEDQLGWSPPDAIESFEVNLPANTHGVIEVQLVSYVYRAFAEKWAVCFVGGVHFEQKLEDISGSYTCIEAAEVDLDTEACF